MRETTFTDNMGRKWLVTLPDDAPDVAASMGPRIGPPPLDELGLPTDIEVRLHNQLHDRGLFTLRDALKRRIEVFAALQAAFRVETEAIISLYRQGG